MLTGVPETMLWTLYSRANEARRPDAFLNDPDSVRIFESISYDYRRSFGPPNDLHAVRSSLFDAALRPWLSRHPGGTVVELAAGLETQFQRCDDGKVQWLCVDVPESIAVRERFIPETPRCRYVALSALDPAWMNLVDDSKGVFITAQGLFMYLEEEAVRGLFRSLAERFAGAEVMFDVIPRWFSRRTIQGFKMTPHYQVPIMPWGVNHNEIEALLRTWSDRIQSVEITALGTRRGFNGFISRVLAGQQRWRNVLPSIAHVRFA